MWDAFPPRCDLCYTNQRKGTWVWHCADCLEENKIDMLDYDDISNAEKLKRIRDEILKVRTKVTELRRYLNVLGEGYHSIHFDMTYPETVSITRRDKND